MITLSLYEDQGENQEYKLWNKLLYFKQCAAFEQWSFIDSINIQNTPNFQFWIYDSKVIWYKSEKAELRLPLTVVTLKIHFIYIERQKKLITSSERHSLKPAASKWVIFG